MKDIFDEVVKEVSKGIIEGVEVFGADRDPDLRVYNRLDQDAFDKLAKRYGFENVAEYIRQMELKRLGVK